MTEERIVALIEQNFGQGRNEGYKAWIRVTRRLSSPVSNLLSVNVPIHKRQLNALAFSTEYIAMLVASWLGACEIRDQMPMWPWPFIHPAAGLNREIDQSLPDPPGLIEIAKKGGIDHGRYVGTNVPYVATVDLMLRMSPCQSEANKQKLVMWSCKPEGKISSTDEFRMHERLKLAELYAEAVGAFSCTFSETTVSKTLAANLEWMTPLRSELQKIYADGGIYDFGGLLRQFSAQETLGRAIANAAKHMRLRNEDGHAYFRACAWLGLIDLDFREPVLMSRKMRTDVSYKESLREALTGSKI